METPTALCKQGLHSVPIFSATCLNPTSFLFLVLSPLQSDSYELFLVFLSLDQT